MSRMRAKFRVSRVQKSDSNVVLEFTAVGSDAGYGPNGESEDNDFARWTPWGELKMSVNNPDLFGAFNEGDKVYLDFTKVE